MKATSPTTNLLVAQLQVADSSPMVLGVGLLCPYQTTIGLQLPPLHLLLVLTPIRLLVKLQVSATSAQTKTGL